jgi:hypothetical protein
MATKHEKGGAPELSPDVERRILRFVNAARLPDDFRRPAQITRDTAGEHALVEHEMHTHRREPRAVPKINLDKDLATTIIRRRPPFGYTSLKELLDIVNDRGRLGRWIDDLITILGGTTFGEWSAPIPIEVGGTEIPIMHAALLRTGKVLLIPSSTQTLLWNLATSGFTLLDSAATGLTANLFCSGHTFLSDGRLLVCGGGGGGPGQATSAQAWKFDPDSETWSKTAADMAYKRWYPTVVTLGDEPGRALVASGWTGGMPMTAPQLEIYSETTDTFTVVSVSGVVGEKVFPQTYPGLHMLPGGEIFYVPTGFGECSQTAAPYVASEPSGYFVFSGATAGSWTDTGVNLRTKGMSALLLQRTYPFVQVLVVGGGDLATSATARLINLSTLSPSWGTPFPLLEGRVHPNVVLLPDGTVFICGGMEATGMPPTGGRCELYDPVGGTLTEMAEVNYPRHYHSVALLLPSGQVMVAAGAQAGGCSLSFYNPIELFSPPYLFMGPRPTITSLPALVHHGSDFNIETPDADAIARVVLVRPMAVTHQTDSEQRVVDVSFVQTGATTLTATMPDGLHPHGLAPRGHYMLFILNAAGVPSEGRFLFLH